MHSKTNLGYPLVYQAKHSDNFDNDKPNQIVIRTEVRALDGMQIQALVYYTPHRTLWRMVSDEGPYLNGTDLSPFLLAFYTASMAFSFVVEILKHADADGIGLTNVELVQDNYYTMDGSAKRGDIIGGALPAELRVTIDSSFEQMPSLIDKAIQSCPALTYNHRRLTNVFCLTVNGKHIPVTGVSASLTPKPDPQANFASVSPQPDNPAEDIIVKRKSAETIFDIEGGAGSSLKSEQKRTLHVRGIVSMGNDGLLDCSVQLFKPIGSTFRFLCDYQNGMIAPPPLAYLSAGVGFCFMTQVGRHATIVKQKLSTYHIVQDNVFTIDNTKVEPHPIGTHLFVEMDEEQDQDQKLLSMSEQTCFLHAAMRSSVPSRVKLELYNAIGEA